MTLHFLMQKFVRYLVAAAVLLNSCRRSTSPTSEEALSVAPPAAATTPSVPYEVPPKYAHGLNDPHFYQRRLQTRFRLDVEGPASIHTENRLSDALARYAVADEATRMDIEEHILQEADAGVARSDLARTLGAMFAMEDSIPVKLSILNE